ncbi:winged helix-turn-helix domain-containing protein [Halorarum salinum]|uniref:Helix-turn-helix transcriptional regulator n=1 Tax=Halorarum salinum TaxID=2743089 RepID=A0A7D5L9E0_9EURY|nr:winged helix-turn-helix domain-containing protein [Halobaculum salinum]QLG61426.1 helix-turn-helix transcriptional regulator [Halobaculum salinum]
MGPSTTRDAEQSAAAAKDEAFQLLSDGTRLEMLQALWEAHDPTDASPLRFSELRERIGADDPGQIYYHLDKLTTHFVRRTEDGYELRESGMRIVRMLLSGTAIDDPEVEPVEVDVSCWYCGGQPELSYRDGWRYLECTNCDARCVDTFPPGVISKNEFPPSGLRGRTADEINEADRIWGAHRRASVMDGVCPECAGDMPVTSVRTCEDHRPDWDGYQFCEACGSIFRTLVSHVCEGCKYQWQMPTLFYPTREPAVVAFYYDHGVEFDLATYEQRTHLLDYREELLSEDPVRIRITIPLEGEELRLTFDERMDVVDVYR